MTSPHPSASDTSPSSSSDRSTTGNAKRITLLVLLAVIVVFALFNLQTVTVHWVFGTFRPPLIFVIAVTLLIGVAVGYGAARYQTRGKITGD